MFEVDKLLSGEIFRNLMYDLSNQKFDSIKKFIAAFSKIAEQDYSESFVCKMQTLCRFLIDIKQYGYVAKILKCSFIFGTYENSEHEGEECVITYAIRKIDDERALAKIVKSCKGGMFTPFFYEYESPSKVAIDLKKYKILKILFENNLCNEEMCYNNWTALQYAAHKRKYDLAKMLLKELKHNPNLYNKHVDLPPLALAADSNDLELAELLLSYGADPNFPDGIGRKPIFYIKSQKMIDILSAHGASREEMHIKYFNRVAADIRCDGMTSINIIDALKLESDEPTLSNGKTNIILHAGKYGDVKSFEILSRFFDRVNSDELIKSVFNIDLFFEDCIRQKDVETLIALTDVLIKAGVHRESDDLSLSPFFTLCQNKKILLQSLEEQNFILFKNICKLGYDIGKDNDFSKDILNFAIKTQTDSLIKYCFTKGITYAPKK